MKKLLYYFFIFLFFNWVMGMFPPSAYAQNLSVTPSLLSIDLATDKPDSQIFYTNNSSQTIELSFSASDVTALEDGYKLSFLDPNTARNYNYRLSSWISFGQKTLVLKSGEKAPLTIFINSKELTPGGHYGSIQAEIIQRNTTQQVKLRGILSSLIFVRTNTGTEIEAGNIHAFDKIRDFFLDFPQSFFFRFQNTGDTTLTPYGLVQVYDIWGNLVGKGVVNDASAPTLPESIRRYDIPIKTYGFLVPNIYRANLFIHFGKGNIKKYSHITFFSQGNIPVLLIMTILLIVGIVLYKRIKK